MPKKTPRQKRARYLQKHLGWRYTYALKWIDHWGATSEDMAPQGSNLARVMEQDVYMATELKKIVPGQSPVFKDSCMSPKANQ